MCSPRMRCQWTCTDFGGWRRRPEPPPTRMRQQRCSTGPWACGTVSPSGPWTLRRQANSAVETHNSSGNVAPTRAAAWTTPARPAAPPGLDGSHQPAARPARSVGGHGQSRGDARQHEPRRRRVAATRPSPEHTLPANARQSRRGGSWVAYVAGSVRLAALRRRRRRRCAAIAKWAVRVPARRLETGHRHALISPATPVAVNDYGKRAALRAQQLATSSTASGSASASPDKRIAQIFKMRPAPLDHR
jgi:hypothetical protein